ncbi:MAG TPA: molybdate ABC transporter substrate-binding protein [Terriglobales bacterium]|nr:molybdate ABC transporter substrate-binding protein [Terriglobales bacterium]
MRTLLLCLALLTSGVQLLAQDALTVAAAADLQPVMTEIAARFEKETGVRVKLSFGSSGNFFAQIQNGAPYDLFFSADVDYPAKLQGAGLIEPGSLYRYATGQIALWAPNASAIDVSKGLSVLVDNNVQKIAIANPSHAPYGRAAEAALKNADLWDSISSKLVMGENIAQTAQFVQSGNTDVGILALSLVLAPAMKDHGKYFIVPETLYPPLQQAAVILKSSQHKELAVRFLRYMKSSEIRSLLQRYGFSSVEANR